MEKSIKENIRGEMMSKKEYAKAFELEITSTYQTHFHKYAGYKFIAEHYGGEENPDFEISDSGGHNYYIFYDIRGNTGLDVLEYDTLNGTVASFKKPKKRQKEYIKKYGVNPLAKDKKLKIPSYVLQERYMDLSGLFLDWIWVKDVNPFHYFEKTHTNGIQLIDKNGKKIENKKDNEKNGKIKLDKTYLDEKNLIASDEYVALYWLIYFGFTADRRYEEVKDTILKHKLDSKLVLIKQAMSFFDIHNENYAFEDFISKGEQKEFLKKHAQMIFLAHSYQYISGDEGLREWIRSVSVYPKAEPHLIRRIRWLRNNLKKYNKWDEFHNLADIKKYKDMLLMSYIYASSPKIKNKDKFANQFISELLEHKNIWSDSTSLSFALRMIWDIRDSITDKALLQKAIDYFSTGQTDSEEYKDLLKSVGASMKEYNLIVNKTKKIEVLYEVYNKKEDHNDTDYNLLREEVVKTIDSIPESILEKVIKNINSKHILASMAFNHIYFSDVTLKVKKDILTYLYYINNKETAVDTIMDENNKNLPIVLSWFYVDKKLFQKKEYGEIEDVYAFPCRFILHIFHKPKVFNFIIELINSEEIFKKPELLKALLENLIGNNVGYYSNGEYYEMNTIAKLNKVQTEVLLKTLLSFLKRAKEKDFFKKYLIKYVLGEFTSDIGRSVVKECLANGCHKKILGDNFEDIYKIEEYMRKNGIEELSEKRKLEIVSKNGNKILYINNPSEEVKLAAVQHTGEAIRYIKNPSKKIQLATVKNDYEAIKYIINPSEEIQLEAIKNDYEAMLYIKNPTDRVSTLAKEYVRLQFIDWVFEWAEDDEYSFAYKKDLYEKKAMELLLESHTLGIESELGGYNYIVYGLLVGKPMSETSLFKVLKNTSNKDEQHDALEQAIKSYASE